MDETKIGWCDATWIAMKGAGVTAEQMVEAVCEFAKHIPPISDTDIALVKENSSMNAIQKWQVIKNMKKAIKEKERIEHKTELKMLKTERD